MADDVNYTEHTRHIVGRIHFIINGEEFNLHYTVWYEGGLQLTDIVTKNTREYELNHILGYTMAILRY